MNRRDTKKEELKNIYSLLTAPPRKRAIRRSCEQPLYSLWLSFISRSSARPSLSLVLLLASSAGPFSSSQSSSVRPYLYAERERKEEGGGSKVKKCEVVGAVSFPSARPRPHFLRPCRRSPVACP